MSGVRNAAPFCRFLGTVKLPTILHQGTNLPVIDPPHPGHSFVGKARQVRRPAVVGNLLGPLATGNGAGHGVEHEDPAQTELTHRDAGGYERSHLFHRFKADAVFAAGKCLSQVEGFSVAIEIPVVVCREGGIAMEFTRQQTAGEGHAGEDAYPLLFIISSGEELVRGTLAETIENDLHRLHVGELDCLERFFDLLDTHSVIANLAHCHQVIQYPEDLRAVVQRGRRAMKLQQIEAVGGKIPQTVFDPHGQVLAAVSFDCLARQTASGFRGHHDLALFAFLELSNQTFAAAIAVDVGGIDKIHSAVDGFLQRSEGFVVRNIAPRAADSPGAKADVRNFPTGASELTVVHGSSFLCRTGGAPRWRRNCGTGARFLKCNLRVEGAARNGREVVAPLIRTINNSNWTQSQPDTKVFSGVPYRNSASESSNLATRYAHRRNQQSCSQRRAVPSSADRMVCGMVFLTVYAFARYWVIVIG